MDVRMLTNERHLCNDDEYANKHDESDTDESSFEDSSFDDDDDDSSLDEYGAVSLVNDEMESGDEIDMDMCKVKVKSNIFLSVEMAHKLNLSQSARALFARPIQTAKENERPQSLHPSNPHTTHHTGSGIVYAIQTESPMMSPVFSVTMDRGDCVTPLEFLRSIWMEHHHADMEAISHGSISTWVPGDVAAYSLPLLSAVRSNDLDGIQAIHERDKHTTLQCANRFGESIVHTVARRGRVEILAYLVEHANISMNVCCDQGRTILHDAAWSTQPNFDCIHYILNRHPEFLRIADNKNFLPLDYVPRSSWSAWNSWLADNKTLLVAETTSTPEFQSSLPAPTVLDSVSRWLLQGL